MLTAESAGGSADPAPRRSSPSHGPEAEALLVEVRASIATLTELFAHEEDLGPDAAQAIRVAAHEVEARLGRRELRVAVVGESGAGKSTFIDALLGERLLGQVHTPPGAVISVRRGSERSYIAR